MRISQKGLYALQALMVLTRHQKEGAIRIREIAYEEDLPQKFLEVILLELKNAGMVQSVRGPHGGYQLRRRPAEVSLSEVIRTIDGPLAPFGGAACLEELINSDKENHALYRAFMQVRSAAAEILDNTSLADVVSNGTITPARNGRGPHHNRNS